MSNINDQHDRSAHALNAHAPSAVFRASLEQEVVQAFRRQSQFDAPPSLAKRSRWRTVATLALGLTIGVGGAVATAQVQSSSARDSLLSAAEAKRSVDLLTLQLRVAAYETTKKAMLAGVRSPEDGLAENVALTLAQTEVTRSETDIQEIKASGKPVRYELWAPLVNGHDYVSDRLRLDAFIESQRMMLAEKEYQRNRLQSAVGITDADSIQLRQEVSMIELERQLIAQRLMLRLDFVKGKYDEKSLPVLLEMSALQNSIMRNVLEQKISGLRLSKLRSLQQAGLTSELDVKRTEVRTLELRLQFEELSKAMKQMQLQSADVLRKKN